MRVDIGVDAHGVLTFRAARSAAWMLLARSRESARAFPAMKNETVTQEPSVAWCARCEVVLFAANFSRIDFDSRQRAC